MKRGVLKKKVLNFVKSKGGSGATYTEIIAFIVKHNLNKEYDWKTDRGYYSVCMQDAHLEGGCWGRSTKVVAGPLRKPTKQCAGYLVKVNMYDCYRYFVMNY